MQHYDVIHICESVRSGNIFILDLSEAWHSNFLAGGGGGGLGCIDFLIIEGPPNPKRIVQSNPASRTPAQYGHLIIMDAHLIWTPHLITDTLLCPWEKSSYIFSKFNPLNTDYGFTKYEHFL